MTALGVAAWIYGEAPLEATLDRIAAAGFDGVELSGEPDRWRPAELRRLLAHSGLRPLALAASCAYPATRRDLAHPDPAVRAEAVAYVLRCLCPIKDDRSAPILDGYLRESLQRLRALAPARIG